MGFIFENSDNCIWFPNRDVGQMFLANVRQLEFCVNCASGLDEYMPETVEVDFDQLTCFLRTVGSWANSDDTSMQLLLKGVMIHLLAILMCGEVLPQDLEFLYPRDSIEEARALSVIGI